MRQPCVIRTAGRIHTACSIVNLPYANSSPVGAGDSSCELPAHFLDNEYRDERDLNKRFLQ